MSVPITQRNLIHEGGKLFLSIAGVAASLTLILLLMGFREGLYDTLTAYVNHLHADLIVAQSGVEGLSSSDSAIPLDLHGIVAEMAQAEEAGHILLADVIFTQSEVKTPVMLVGYEPAAAFGSPWKLGQGRLLEADDEILVDSWLAKRTGIALDDRVDLLGGSFKVVGLTRETSSWMSPYIFVTLKAAGNLLGISGTVSYHLLRLPDGIDVEDAAQAIEKEVTGVDALTPQAIAQADQRVLSTIMDTPINVMLFIGVVIGIAVIGLTAYTSIIDHLREYGVLMAVGASGLRLGRLVVSETLYRAVLGYLLGIGLSYVAAFVIMARWPQFNILIRPENIAQAGLLALVMSLIAALIPVRGLSRIDPMIVFKS
jgi:putative ABC transport system permease protein